MQTKKPKTMNHTPTPCEYCSDEIGNPVYHKTTAEIVQCRINWENWAYDSDLPAHEREALS